MMEDEEGNEIRTSNWEKLPKEEQEKYTESDHYLEFGISISKENLHTNDAKQVNIDGNKVWIYASY